MLRKKVLSLVASLICISLVVTGCAIEKNETDSSNSNSTTKTNQYALAKQSIDPASEKKWKDISTQFVKDTFVSSGTETGTQFLERNNKKYLVYSTDYGYVARPEYYPKNSKMEIMKLESEPDIQIVAADDAFAIAKVNVKWNVSGQSQTYKGFMSLYEKTNDKNEKLISSLEKNPNTEWQYYIQTHFGPGGSEQAEESKVVKALKECNDFVDPIEVIDYHNGEMPRNAIIKTGQDSYMYLWLYWDDKKEKITSVTSMQL